MSTRLFQGMIHQMRTAIDRIIGVVEWRDGTVIDVVRQLAKK